MTDMTRAEKLLQIMRLEPGDRVRIEVTVREGCIGELLLPSLHLRRALELSNDLINSAHRIEKVDLPHDWTKKGWARGPGEEFFRCHGLTRDDRVICESSWAAFNEFIPGILTPITDLKDAPEWVQSYEANPLPPPHNGP